MANELDWQAKIVKRIRDEGGYGRKWSSMYTVGVPDLILIPQLFSTLFVEVKLEKDLKSTFERKLKVTQKQKEELNRIGASGGTGFLLVVCHFSPSKVYFVLKPTPTMKEDVRVTHQDLKSTLSCIKWAGSKTNLTTFIIRWVSSEFERQSNQIR